MQPHPNDDFTVVHEGKEVATVCWAPDSGVMGRHNQLNALAAIAAAQHIGISPRDAASALAQFKNVKRRLETVGQHNGITIYDDFAHHPTAITTTLDGLRRRVGNGRILAVLEPRSNTMKLGIMKAQLPASLEAADRIYAYGAASGKEALGWDLAEVLSPLNQDQPGRASAFNDLARSAIPLCLITRDEDDIL
jgi:UDP-N-acetylmuramate: L-alanyl-gamma-D-glutamyl-meso-diaminopimelate ligase